MTQGAELDAAVQAVVPLAIEGDRRALQSLINLIHPEVVRYCRSRVGSARYPTADDIAQEICLAVARAMPNYEDKGLPFMAFVYKLAANKIVDARRVHGRDLAQPVDEFLDDAETPDTPESELLLRDSCNDMSKLLDVLNEKSREILTLRVFGGYSAEETARIVGSSAGAVRVAQFRALAKLRKHLEKEAENATHE